MISFIYLLIIAWGGWAYANYVMIGGRPWERVVAALPFGLVLFTLTLNSGLITGLSMNVSLSLSLIALALLGGVGIFRVHPKRGEHYQGWECLFLFLGGLTVLVYAWLWYLIVLDDDIYMHYPLIGMFRDGVFPHHNPFFPNLMLKGHYARDLVLGGLARLSQLSTETVMLVFGLIQSTLNFFISYMLFRQMFRRPLASFLITSFLYFCLSAGHADFLLRSGLVEATHNNNPLVILWCLVILFQLNRFYRKGGWADAAFAGVLMGALGFVYESYLPYLFLALLAAFVIGLGRLLRLRGGVPKTALLVLSMIAVMFTQGGVFADWAGRFVDSRPALVSEKAWAGSIQQELSGTTQEVQIHFPKNPFLSWTDPNGKSIPVFSWRFLKDQGMPAFFVFPLLIYFVRKREVFGTGFAMLGLGTILITSMVSFGRFDPDTYRLLFLAALGAGAAYALGFYRLLEKWVLPWKRGFVIALILSLVFLLAHSQVFLSKWIYHLKLGFKYPGIHLIDPKAHLPNIMQFPLMGETDERAMKFLREQPEKGRLLTNYPFLWQDPPQFNNSRLVLSAWSGMPAAGFGLGVPVRESFSLQVFVYGHGFRSIAYWNSGAPELLKSMQVQWLYLFPESAKGENLSRWEAAAGLEKVTRFPDTGSGERLLFKVRPMTLPEWSANRVPSFEIAREDSPWQKAQYRELDVQFDRALEFSITVRQLIVEKTSGRLMNADDGLVQVFEQGHSRGRIRIVAPFFAGIYSVKFQILSAEGLWKDMISNPVTIHVKE